MPRGLTPEEERERDARTAAGETGASSPRLDYLNRKLTAAMTDAELEAAAQRYPNGQAQAALNERRKYRG